MEFIGRLLNVPSIDPDDQRRSRLLNILLLGVAALSFLVLLATIFADVTELESQVSNLYLSSLTMLGGAVLIFAINRYWSGMLASSLFLLLFTVAVAFTDEPRNVVDGRSLFLFTVPILMASVILRPWASFIIAGLSSLVISAIALSLPGYVPPVPSMLGLFAVALVAWLSARSMEGALRDLRVLNVELDQRVRDRTQELGESLSRNEAILEGIADGVIVFDNDGQATVANPAIADLLEQPADEITGRDIETLMGDEVDATDREMLVALLGSRETYYPSVKLEWGDKTLSASVAPVRVASGEAIGTVAVFRDFTREAEIDRMKSTFVSIASHELRTPLNAVMGYIEMLQEGIYGPLSKAQRDTLERVVANTGHLLSLVGNLLDQAQIEAGTLTLDVTPFAPTELIAEVVGVMGVLGQPKGLTLTSHIAADLPATLFGDRQRLHQILVNLLGNAVKFTDEGEVQIRAYRPDANRWALEVSDTGCGISPEAQPYIFEPFKRADESITRRYSGAGLGLSIVKQLTEMMGGEVILKSAVGRGSTFTIILPLVPPVFNLDEGLYFFDTLDDTV